MSQPKFLDAVDEAREWFLNNGGRGDIPADPYVAQGWSMCGCHLVITEGLGSIYKQALTIKPEDEVDFAGYIMQFINFLSHHHHSEEEWYLPTLKQLETPIEEEHEAFAETLHDLEAYIRNIAGFKNDLATGSPIWLTEEEKIPAVYDGNKVRAYLEALEVPLFSHLKAEIGYLSSENMKKAGITVEQLEKLEAISAKHHQKEIDPLVIGIFIVLHSPPPCGFPPAPGWVKNYLVPWVLAFKYRRVNVLSYLNVRNMLKHPLQWWRFAPTW